MSTPRERRHKQTKRLCLRQQHREEGPTIKPQNLFWPVFLLIGAVSGIAAFFSTAAAITFAFAATEFAHQGLICNVLVFAPVVLFLAEMIGACLVRKKLDGMIRVRSVLGYLGVLLLLYCLPYWVLFLAT